MSTILKTGPISVKEGVELVGFFKGLSETGKKSRTLTLRDGKCTTIEREANIPEIGKATLVESHDYKKTSQYYLKL